jgi:hypothetical protein
MFVVGSPHHYIHSLSRRSKTVLLLVLLSFLLETPWNHHASTCVQARILEDLDTDDDNDTTTTTSQDYSNTTASSSPFIFQFNNKNDGRCTNPTFCDTETGQIKPVLLLLLLMAILWWICAMCIIMGWLVWRRVTAERTGSVVLGRRGRRMAVILPIHDGNTVACSVDDNEDDKDDNDRGNDIDLDHVDDDDLQSLPSLSEKKDHGNHKNTDPKPNENDNHNQNCYYLPPSIDYVHCSSTSEMDEEDKDNNDDDDDDDADESAAKNEERPPKGIATASSSSPDVEKG